MKKNTSFALVGLIFLASQSAVFAAPEKPTAPKKAYQDPYKADKYSFYEAMSNLKHAREELGKVSDKFAGAEREKAIQEIETALSDLDSVVKNKK